MAKVFKVSCRIPRNHDDLTQGVVQVEKGMKPEDYGLDPKKVESKYLTDKSSARTAGAAIEPKEE